MIIYGYKNREIEQSAGSFHCSNCGVRRLYKHKKVVRYFTLFFIPLFPLGKLSEYVECQVCRRTYQYQPEFLSANSTDGIVDGLGNALNVEPNRASPIMAPATPTAAPVSSPTTKSCLIPGLIIGGGLGFLLGCIVAIGAGLVQYSSPDNMEGFIAFMVICPAPAIVVGIIMLTIGLLQARKGQIEER